jgi:hypothetical protein
MKLAHGPYALKTLRTPGRETARNRKRPATHSSSDALHVLGRHAARDEKRSTSPFALDASRAPGRNLGLGRESFIPPGLNLGPVSMSRHLNPTAVRGFRPNKTALRLRRANPSLISIFLCSLSRAATATPSDRRAAPERACPRRRPEPLTGVRAHRWVNAPPSSSLSGASTDERQLRRGSSPAQIHKGSAGEILGPTTRR